MAIVSSAIVVLWKVLLLILRNCIGPMWTLYSFPKFSLQNTLKPLISGRLYFWFLFVCFWDGISFCSPGWPGTYGFQVGLKVTTSLQPPHLSEGLSHPHSFSSLAWHCKNVSQVLAHSFWIDLWCLNKPFRNLWFLKFLHTIPGLCNPCPRGLVLYLGHCTQCHLVPLQSSNAISQYPLFPS